MKTKIFLFGVFMATNLTVFSQVPAIEWEKSFGGSIGDEAYSVRQTSDGGYIVAGSSASIDGDVDFTHGSSDCWILKLDAAGSIQWQKSLGGSDGDGARDIIQTTDKGYAVAANSYSSDGELTVNHGVFDFWIVKLDTAGSIQWQKSLGGSKDDWAQSIVQTNDSGFAITGYTSSNDGDVSGFHGTPGQSFDVWVVKLDANGNIQWQKCLGGTYADQAYSIIQTTDGGYAVAGESMSNDGDVSGNHGDYDFWIVKLDGNGNIQWQKSLGGNTTDKGFSMIQTADKGYVVVGRADSNNGDVTGNNGFSDVWIVRLDSNANIQWQEPLGGINIDQAFSVAKTSDGGYVILGGTNSNDGDVNGFHGTPGNGVPFDYWVVKLDFTGIIQWQKCLGGSNNEHGSSIIQSMDGDFLIAGYSDSNDGDISAHHGTFNNDYWVVKLAAPSGIVVQPTDKVNIFPNPGTGIFNIQISSSPVQTAEAFNLLGEKVFSTSTLQHSNSIDLSSQPEGVYFLHLKTAEGMVVKKIVISR